MASVQGASVGAFTSTRPRNSGGKKRWRRSRRGRVGSSEWYCGRAGDGGGRGDAGFGGRSAGGERRKSMNMPECCSWLEESPASRIAFNWFSASKSHSTPKSREARARSDPARVVTKTRSRCPVLRSTSFPHSPRPLTSQAPRDLKKLASMPSKALAESTRRPGGPTTREGPVIS